MLSTLAFLFALFAFFFVHTKKRENTGEIKDNTDYITWPRKAAPFTEQYHKDLNDKKQQKILKIGKIRWRQTLVFSNISDSGFFFFKRKKTPLVWAETGLL